METVERKIRNNLSEAEEKQALNSTRITEEVIHAVVSRLARVLRPEKIVVFGSAIAGDPSKAHDLDIMVVMESDKPRHKRSVTVDDALDRRRFPLDSFVLTPQEFRESFEQGNPFLKTILATGKVMYERESA